MWKPWSLQRSALLGAACNLALLVWDQLAGDGSTPDMLSMAYPTTAVAYALLYCAGGALLFVFVAWVRNMLTKPKT